MMDCVLMDKNRGHVLEQRYRAAFAALCREVERIKAGSSIESNSLDPQLIQQLITYESYRVARDALFEELQQDEHGTLTASAFC